jgi:hypothetical protein
VYILNLSRNGSHALIKISIILILLACSVRVLAGCRADQSGGWEIFSICEANFDEHGNYVNSTCNMGPPPSASQTSMNMCKSAPEGCSGSACSWDGPLNE